MDSFLQKFSLQNLLRQFFCGVVFFVPLWLFTQACGYKCCSCSIVDITTWEAGTFFLFASLASVIGTIIYHIEKNLYSYSIQTLFEVCSRHGNLHMRVVPLLVAGAITLVVSPLFHISDMEKIFDCYMVALIFFIVVSIFNVLFTDSFIKVMKRTRVCWFIEEQISDKSSVDMFARWAVAKRISSWSDFIHCTQSCCIAWLLGCALCKLIENNADMCMWNEPLFELSILIAGSVLFLEIIFDWHRYQHVIAMPETDLLDDIQNDFPHMKINDKAVSKCREIMVETTVKSKDI